MKLSDLIAERQALAAADGEAPLPTTAFGVEIDEEFVDFDPPSGLDEIGLVARFKDDGDFKDELLDIAISYQMAPKPVSVMLEIPAEETIGDIVHVVSTIEAVNASASFLPPEVLTEETFEAYCQRMEAVAAAWASKVNFSHMVLPVTSYFQHMIVALIDPALGQSFVPDDPYILERFHNRIPVELSDVLKARLAVVIRNSFTDDDGIDRFDETMIALCLKQIDHVEDITKEMAANQPVPAAMPEDSETPAPVKAEGNPRKPKTPKVPAPKAKVQGPKKAKTPTAKPASASESAQAKKRVRKTTAKKASE